MPSSNDTFPITLVANGYAARIVEAEHLTENGVLILETSPSYPEVASGSLLLLADEVELCGIAIYESMQDFTDDPLLQSPMILAKAQAGATATIKHQAAGAWGDQYKFFVLRTGSDLVLRDDQLVPLLYDRERHCWSVYPMLVPRADSRILAGPTALLVNTAIHGTYYGDPATVTEIAVNLNNAVPALNSATVQLTINGSDVTDGDVAIPANTAAGTKIVKTPSGATLVDGDRIGARISSASGLVLGSLSVTTCLKLAIPA